MNHFPILNKTGNCFIFCQKKHENQNLGTTPRPGLRPGEVASQI